MAEEEAGFTFVDKRKVVAEEQAGDMADQESFGSESTSQTQQDDGNDDTLDDVEMPDVYMLLQYCVQLLAADAWQKMGLVADPRTGKVTTDLAQVKVAVDAVGDIVTRLEAAPDGSVDDGQKRELKNVLNNLRLNYVNQRSALREGVEV